MTAQTSGVLAQHQAALNEGRFLIQKCTACTQHIYFPREVCPHCGAMQWTWVTPSGQGTVYATTTVRRKPAEGGDYNVCLIDLDEGVRLMSCVEQLPAHEVQIGLRVHARVRVVDGRGMVVFDPLPGGVV